MPSSSSARNKPSLTALSTANDGSDGKSPLNCGANPLAMGTSELAFERAVALKLRRACMRIYGVGRTRWDAKQGTAQTNKQARDNMTSDQLQQQIATYTRLAFGYEHGKRPRKHMQIATNAYVNENHSKHSVCRSWPAQQKGKHHHAGARIRFWHKDDEQLLYAKRLTTQAGGTNCRCKSETRLDCACCAADAASILDTVRCPRSVIWATLRARRKCAPPTKATLRARATSFFQLSPPPNRAGYSVDLLSLRSKAVDMPGASL